MSCKEPQAGDLVKVKGHPIPYRHYGVYVGHGEVIHLSALECREKRKRSNDVHHRVKEKKSSKKLAFVHRVTLKMFIKNDSDDDDDSDEDDSDVFEVVTCPYDVKRSDVVRRAEMAEDQLFRNCPYDLIFNNCEHFARVKQVQDVAKGMAISSAVAVGVGLVVGLATILFSGDKERKEKTRPYYI